MNKNIKLTVKCCIPANDTGLQFLRKEYNNYKHDFISKIQKAIRPVIKQTPEIKVYSAQKWLIDRSLYQHVKNLPFHSMQFTNQSVWISETEKGQFYVHFRNKQLPRGTPITCKMIVPRKYNGKMKLACGKNNEVLGQVELIEDNKYGRFNLHVTLRLPKPETYTPKGWVGVDIGWNCLAVSAFVTENEIADVTFHVKNFRTRIIQLEYLLKEYQRSNRSWKKWNFRLKNVTKYTTGLIANEITTKARKHKAGIVLEDLTFRSRTKQFLIPCYKIKCAIQTLCERKGIPFMLVNPRNTSITCNRCGVINKQSRNNKNFICKSCGYTCNADFNAAVNIARKALMPKATGSRLKPKKLYASKVGELPTPSDTRSVLKPSVKAVDTAGEGNTKEMEI